MSESKRHSSKIFPACPPHGIGTMGASEEKEDFVDFLVKAGQAYWQILRFAHQLWRQPLPVFFYLCGQSVFY